MKNFLRLTSLIIIIIILLFTSDLFVKAGPGKS